MINDKDVQYWIWEDEILQKNELIFLKRRKKYKNKQNNSVQIPE